MLVNVKRVMSIEGVYGAGNHRVVDCNADDDISGGSPTIVYVIAIGRRGGLLITKQPGPETSP